MKPTQFRLRLLAALPFVLVLALAPAHAAQVHQSTPAAAQWTWDEEVLLDNLKNLFSPNDDAKTGSGEKDSMLRLKLGPAVLRGDAKLDLGWNGDARGKNNDDLAVDMSLNGLKKDNDDAEKAGKWSLDAIAGVALDLQFGRNFEVVSIEYKKDLLKRGTKEFFKPKELEQPKKPWYLAVLSSDDFTVKLAGFTVRCDGQSQEKKEALGKEVAQSGKDGITNGALVKNGIRMQFMAGPLPIIVRGNAGLSLNFNLGPAIDIEHMAFGLEFEPAVYVHGWLSAGVGVAVPGFSACAGIVGKLRFVDITVECGAGVVLAGPAARYGGVKVTLQPVKFEAQLFVALQVGWLSRTLAWTIFTGQLAKHEWQFGTTPLDVLPAAPPPPAAPPATVPPGSERPGNEEPARKLTRPTEEVKS